MTSFLQLRKKVPLYNGNLTCTLELQICLLKVNLFLKPGTHYSFFPFKPVGWKKKKTTVSSGQSFCTNDPTLVQWSPSMGCCVLTGGHPPLLPEHPDQHSQSWLRALIRSRSAAGFSACSSDRSRPNGRLLSDRVSYTQVECQSFFIELVSIQPMCKGL